MIEKDDNGGRMPQVPWITSMSEFAPIVLPILDMVGAKRICEIGASYGGHSKLLADYLRKRQGNLISIDPMPQQAFVDWARTASDVVTHIREASLSGIFHVGNADAWFIDGDHNWYTVFNELACIETLAQKNNQPLLIFLHDVSWPCARRDMYYDPNAIPAEYRHPYSSELGITLDNPNSIEGGFRGPNWATKEGGPKNGILTAIEDFMAAAQTRFHWIHVPAILGLGVLVNVNHPYAKQIVEFYAPYHNNPVMATLERDRISKYLTIVELNQKIEKLTAVLGNLTKYCESF